MTEKEFQDILDETDKVIAKLQKDNSKFCLAAAVYHYQKAIKNAEYWVNSNKKENIKYIKTSLHNGKLFADIMLGRKARKKKWKAT